MTINKIKKHKIESNVFLSQTLILSLIFTLRLRLGRDIFCREKFLLTGSDWGVTFLSRKIFTHRLRLGRDIFVEKNFSPDQVPEKKFLSRKKFLWTANAWEAHFCLENIHSRAYSRSVSL